MPLEKLVRKAGLSISSFCFAFASVGIDRSSLVVDGAFLLIFRHSRCIFVVVVAFEKNFDEIAPWHPRQLWQMWWLQMCWILHLRRLLLYERPIGFRDHSISLFGVLVSDEVHQNHKGTFLGVSTRRQRPWQ